MSPIPSRLLLTTALLAIVAPLGAAPSTAAITHRTGPRSAVSTGPDQAAPLAKSRHLAGYRVTDPGHPYEVIIKAVDVPDVNCSDPDFEGVAIGAGSEPVDGAADYFAGIFVTCRGGQAQYLMDARVGDLDHATGIEAGDQAQIEITLFCDGNSSCDIFAGAVSLDSGFSVSVQTRADLTTDSALFGAFPLFDGNSTRPAPVPDFADVRVQGCLFDGQLIRNRSADRIKRVQHGTVQIKATKIHVGSFKLKRPD